MTIKPRAEGRLSGLPKAKVKENMFSVRIDDDFHNQVLFVTALEQSNRAPTFTKLAKIGLEAYAAQMGISLKPEDVEAFLAEHGVITPSK